MPEKPEKPTTPPLKQEDQETKQTQTRLEEIEKEVEELSSQDFNQLSLEEIRQVRDRLKELLKEKQEILGIEEEQQEEQEQEQEFTPEEIRESIKKIKEEKGLDIEFEVNKKGWVSFRRAKEKIGQIVEILKDKNCKVTKINLGEENLGPEEVAFIA